MDKKQWFSTQLRFVIMVEPIGGNVLCDCVFLLRSENFQTAFSRALNIGSGYQKQYINGDGERVWWKFMSVISIDIIDSDDLNGAEIHSDPIHLRTQETIPFETEFHPEDSKPIQTI